MQHRPLQGRLLLVCNHQREKDVEFPRLRLAFLLAEEGRPSTLRRTKPTPWKWTVTLHHKKGSYLFETGNEGWRRRLTDGYMQGGERAP